MDGRTPQNRAVPELVLERYLAGDLPPAERRRIEQICERSDAVRARLEELARERQQFLAADPPARFAHRVATTLSVAGDSRARGGRRWAWLLAPSFAAAAMVMLAVTFSRVTQPSPSARSAAKREAAGPAAGRAELDRPLLGEQGSGAAPSGQAAAPPPAASGSSAGRASSRDELAPRQRVEDANLGALRAKASAAPPPAPVVEAPPGARRAASESAAARPEPEESGLAERPSRKEVLARLEGLEPALRSCLDAALEAKQVAPGSYTLVLSWRIEPDGRPRDARLESPAALGSTPLGQCVLGELGRLRFPESRRGRRVRLPLGPFPIH